jgi:hypothetical protein
MNYNYYSRGINSSRGRHIIELSYKLVFSKYFHQRILIIVFVDFVFKGTP